MSEDNMDPQDEKEQGELFNEENGGEIITDDEVVNINDAMKSAYLDYAMSVIVGRALPDVRDGLKPVHRRILYSMYASGFLPGRPYKKSARIVGDVLGRYHPHGDTAVYDSLVRMAQDFSLRYMLIDGQGNYGSIDGDNAAAMRYTEARMTKLSIELLRDIEKETVDFVPNFDESLEEPSVLPTRVPTLLLNGTSGIAVGMATNIPPHNLGEVLNAVEALIDNPDISVEELCEHVPGPDFPTGALICGNEGIRKAYETGRGVVVVRAKYHMEDVRNKRAIIIDEIPYQVNKANLIMKIADLVNDKKLTGISDLRDESDRKGMRIYIELKRDAVEAVVINQLFKHTALQSSFGINMVALVRGIPKTLSLKEVLMHYVEHRKEVIVRRTEHDLRLAKNRLHILEGLRIALENIDEIIKLIKAAPDAAVAKTQLMERFSLSEKQSTAILEMRLQRLTGLERDKIEAEYKELVERIADLEDLLKNEPRILNVIKDEHSDINSKFGDERRTEIGLPVHTMEMEDLIPDQDVAILISKKGLIKRMPVETFRSQLRGGRGVSGMSTRDDDIIDNIIVTSTHQYLLCFASSGKVHKIKAYDVPESSRQSKGTSIAHFLQLPEEEYITTIIPVRSFDTDETLIMVTAKGIVKKTALSAYSHFKTRAIIGINLDEGDTLNWVMKSKGKQDIILATTAGMVIRFSEDQVREVGRASRGVKGIKIKEEDALVSARLLDPEDEKSLYLLMTRKGYGKNLRVNEFKNQNRGGIGVKALRFRKTVKGDEVTGALVVCKEDDIIAATTKGTVCRQKIENISVQRRGSQGVCIIKLDASDTVEAIAKVIKTEEDEQQQTLDAAE